MSPHHERGPVVVGVDGSEQALHAVRWAAREAESLETSLQLTSALGYAADVRGSRRMGKSFYDIVVENRVLLRDHPVHALLTQSAQAQLLVVGSRGRGAMAGTLLGSVSQAVLHQASCPVAVVRPGTEHDAT